MFTETSFGENVGEIKEESPVIDLDLRTGKLSVSPIPYESSCVGPDGPSMSMLELDFSGDDLVLSDFGSISVAEPFEPRDDEATGSTEADVFDSIGQVDTFGKRRNEEKYASKFGSSDLSSIPEPYMQRDGEAEVLVGIDKTCKPNHPPIVYTSSRRSSSLNTKINQKNDSRKPSKGRRIAIKNPVLNLSSLQRLRRSRSSSSRQARSSVWGCMGNILPNFDENNGLDLNSGNDEKLRRVRSGKGKSNAIRNQTGRKSIGQRCGPTGHISLKVKIGDKICSLGNATEDSGASGEYIDEQFDTTKTKLREKASRDITLPCERHMEKLTSSDAYAFSTQLDASGTFDNLSFNNSSDFHRIVYLDGGDNLGAPSVNQFSDVGTSPDSEVINSVPDASLCEKGLPDIQQDSPIMSKACVSPSDIPSSILLQKKSKKEKKKDKPNQVDNWALEGMLTGAEPTNNVNLPVSLGGVSILISPRTKSKKGKKKDKLHEAGDCRVESKLTGAETTNCAKVHADLEVGQKVGDDVSYCSDASMATTAKPYLNGSEVNPCSEPTAAIVSSNSQGCDTLIPCSNGKEFPKCSRAKGSSKGRSRILDLSSEKDKASKKNLNRKNVVGKGQVNDNVGASGVVNRMESLLATGNPTPFDLGETGALSKDISGPIKSLQFSSDRMKEQYLPTRNAWVLCDDCQKWRRIPATLADLIEETNCGWTCKDNMDKDFADCSIPQEKSNSEINEELEISDGSWEEDARGSFLEYNQSRSKIAQQSSWSLIKSNLFLQRSRKTQTIDEVMVCHCKPPSDGRMGCGAKCLNRMLNIECVQGTCPCGELCSNHQFQKRKYAKLKWFRCGKKGYGLQALEDISERQFLIEYVGEVLDVRAYEARQREYALDGHKHFYFMTLNGSEVIDACAKGNLGRFINHSCDPNCRTEKWMVNGEVCIGLFSLRDIKKGEEITFDYNYVRVFGAAAKKCVCGSPSCRGYIGGDPKNSEVVVQDDSDDEYTEPVMVCGDKEMNEDWTCIMSNFVKDGENEIANEPAENRYSMKKHISARGERVTESQTSEGLTKKIGSVNSSRVAETMARDRFGVDDPFEQLDINKSTGKSLKGSTSATLKVSSEGDGLRSQMHSSSQLMDISLRSDGKAMSSAHESAYATASSSKSLSDTVESKRKMNYATVGGNDEPAKSNSLAKTSHASSSIKKRKPKMNVVNDKETPDLDKSNAALHTSKKLLEHPLNSAFEAVEEKLNELLDLEGGISKRKDASRGYLKLLFLTAASGNNGHGEAIQSNRDLSMILDALLKTKSRTVLVDIINKNGLQMLHNIMKRYRKEFIKTPILRKLLKILEYLATREILTLEHITGGPPRAGVESFKDSVLTLTEHADKQVHQIARNFRDRWIPRSLRKNCCMDIDDGRTESNQRPGCGGLSVSYTHCSDRGGKPSEAINSCETQLVAASATIANSTLDLPSALGSSCGTSGTKTHKRKSRWDDPVKESPHSRSRIDLAGDEKLNMDEDVPPGFSSPCNGPIVLSVAPSAAINHQQRKMHIKQHPFNAILGDSQSRFVARMPVSYGVPYSVVHQFGVLKAETSEGWNIAPGVPFHPFPPLPPYDSGKGDRPTSATRCASSSECAEKAKRGSDTCITYQTSQKRTRTCNMHSPEKNVSVANGRPDFQQGGSNSLGRHYFRQQKFNNLKLAPPWVRMRNSWGYAGKGI